MISSILNNRRIRCLNMSRFSENINFRRILYVSN